MKKEILEIVEERTTQARRHTRRIELNWILLMKDI